MLKLAFLVSGSGSNMQSVIDAIESGRIDAKAAVVIASNDQAFALNRARNHGIDAFVVSKQEYPNDSDREKRILEILWKYDIDLIVLAGYLSVLSSDFVSHFPSKIINIHPSLLPKYGGKGMYGLNVHRAVLAGGETRTGATVHYVDSGTDTGEIIAQMVVDVRMDDTPESLQARVLHEAEHKLLPDVLERLCNKL